MGGCFRNHCSPATRFESNILSPTWLRSTPSRSGWLSLMTMGPQHSRQTRVHHTNKTYNSQHERVVDRSLVIRNTRRFLSRSAQISTQLGNVTNILLEGGWEIDAIHIKVWISFLPPFRLGVNFLALLSCFNPTLYAMFTLGLAYFFPFSRFLFLCMAMI
jgi:hypothetical protein